MTENAITREGFLAQWAGYGFSPEEVKNMVDSNRITSKNVFTEFLHWYLDGKLMFAEYIDKDGYQYIRYRKEIDWGE